MSDIRPFKGYRPRPDLVTQVAAPPYDVLNSDEAREMSKGNCYSFLRVSKAEVDFPPGTDEHSDAVYRKSLDNWRGFIADGTFHQDPVPCFYVYEQTMDGRSQTGLMCGVSAEEYEKGLIKKHELTRRDKEDDRAHHTDVQDANTEPVMLTYRARADLDALVAEVQTTMTPAIDFVAPDGIGHRLWVVSSARQVGAFQAAFREVEALYVADGHHRSAAGYRVRNLRRDRNPKHTGDEAYNHYLAVLFPDTQLRIMGYHRVVKDLNGLTPEQLLARLRERFDVTPLTYDPACPEQRRGEPSGLHHVTMLLEGQWYDLVAKPGTFDPVDPVGSLDCSILQQNLLAPVLGIEDPRTDKRVDFVGGIRGTREIVRRCGLDAKVGFVLYPVLTSQLMAIADTGAIMPPKSTWFEPKLRSGLVVRSLAE